MLARLRNRTLALGLVASSVLAATAGQADHAAARQCRTTSLVEFNGTIVDAAIATPALSTLVSLVVAANLAGALSAPGDLTVFAPTNDAFGEIPAPVLGAIGADPALLTAVLTYHVSPSRVDPRRSRITREVPTLQGQTLFVEYDRGPQVNQSKASCQGVRTLNGTVWIIDSVLLPQFRPAAS